MRIKKLSNKTNKVVISIGLGKSLYIILDQQEKGYLTKEEHLDSMKNNDLVTFVSIESDKDILRMKFENIYDLSQFTNKSVVDFYFDKVLNLNFNKEDGTLDENSKKDYDMKSKYEKIYMYEDKKLIICNIEIKKETNRFILQNRYYGIDSLLKEYSSYEGVIYPFIEHSPLWDGGFSHSELEIIAPSILAYSDNRRDYILKSNETTRDIVRIGPYIHYAKNLYNNKFMSHIKSKLGKTLLAFPAHSQLYIKTDYDENEFAKYIEKFVIENNYDSVLICMFHYDVMLERDSYFKEKGFKVVSGGHKYDRYFLCKLKTMINLCDYTISNTFSTNIGYCVYLNKPHHIFMQDVIFDKQVPGKKFKKLEVPKYEMCKKFSGIDNNITQEQYELCNKYWGFEHTKTKEEIKFILEFYEDIYIKCKNKICENMNMSEIEKILNDSISLRLSSISNKYNKLILESRQ